jgi:hypothetical protein
MKDRLQKAQQYIDNAMKEVQDEYWILESRADLEKQADFLGKAWQQAGGLCFRPEFLRKALGSNKIKLDK